jgi:hypothetical protein
MQSPPKSRPPKIGPWLRVSLPLAMALLVSVWWVSIIQKDDRAISRDEFIVAGLALAIASQPMLLNEVIRAALRKID